MPRANGATGGGEDDDSLRTVGCALERLVPDPAHRAAILRVVERTHRATTLATLLLNLLLRQTLDQDEDADVRRFFDDPNWLLNAFYAVTRVGSERKGKRANVDPDLLRARDELMPVLELGERDYSCNQAFLYACRNLATVASTNVWKHFHARLLAHVRSAHTLDEAAFRALSKDERRARAALLRRGLDVVVLQEAEEHM